MRARLVRPSSVAVLVGLVAALLIGVLQQRADAAMYTVNTPGDAVGPVPDTACDAEPLTPGEQCTLREAVIAANLNPGADLISLPTTTPLVELTIAPTLGANDLQGLEGDLDITESVEIKGAANGPNAHVIDASALGDRIFQVRQNVAVDLTLTNLTLRGGTANLEADSSNNGGAIHQTIGTLTTFNVDFTNNTAQATTGGMGGDGGAVYTTDGVVTDIQQSIATGNTARRGAVLHADGSTTTIKGEPLRTTRWSENTATLQAGAVEADGGSLALVGVTFRDNAAEDRGGAVGVLGGGTTLTVTGGSFERNVVVDGGGTNGGGVIFGQGGGSVTIRGASFLANTNGTPGTTPDGVVEDGGDGGAILLQTGFTLDVGPDATVDPAVPTTFDSNTALRWGGAISTQSPATITDTVFTGNQAGERAGAVYDQSNATTITGSTFTDNAVTFRESPGVLGTVFVTGGFGGALSTGVGADLVVASSVFDGNSARLEGGAIHFEGNTATGVLTDNTYRDNVATGGTSTSGATLRGQGGAISMRNSEQVTILRGLFDPELPNRADDGGAITNQNGTLAITDVTVAGHAAETGGAVLLEAGDTTITGSTFTGNGATAGDGGAILLGTDGFGRHGSLSVDDATFAGNSATRDGGAISTDAGTVDLVADTAPVVLTGNTAGRNGGGLHAVLRSSADGFTTSDTDADVTITNATFGGDGSNSAASGGAIWAGRADDAESDEGAVNLAVDETTFVGNTATGTGGTVAVDGLNGEVPDAGGSAPGAIVTITDSSITGGSGATGGAIGAVGFSDTDVVRSSIVGATSTAGGVVDATADASLGILNTTISATSGGAAVDGDGPTTIRNTTIARTTGAGVAATGATSLGFVVLEDNASACDTTGGAPTSEGGNVTDDGTCALGGATDVVADANLLDLMTVGGDTFHLLPPDSPAVDIAEGAVDLDGAALTQDQREVTRPRDGDGDDTATADAGAIELDAGLLVTAGETAFEDGPVPTTFTIGRVGGNLTGELTVTYSVLVDDGDAAGQVTPTFGTAVIPAEEDSADVIITPVDDTVAEPTRTITLVVNDLEATDTNPYAPANAEDPSVDLVDDDTVVTIAASDDGDEDGPTPGTFVLTRAGDLTEELTVDVAVDETSTTTSGDVTVPATVTFAAESDTATLTVTVLDDELFEGTESLVVRVVPTDPATYTVGTDGGTATIDVIDDELRLSITTVADAQEPATDGVVRVSREGDDSTELVVPLAIGASSTATRNQDYTTPDPFQAVIPAGETSVDVTLDVLDDVVQEPTETIVVNLAPANGEPVADGAGSTTVLLADDDQRVAVVASDPDAAEPGDDGELTFTRSSTVDELTFRVAYSGEATNGEDVAADQVGNPLPTTFTFPDGVDTLTVDVVVVDDMTFEGDEDFVVTVVDGAGYRPDQAATATVTIADDDVVIGVANLADAAEPATDGAFRFTRSGNDTTTPVTVTYTVSGTATPGSAEGTDGDYAPLSGTVTFGADETTVDVTVFVRDDELTEDPETVVVTLDEGEAPIDDAASSATVTIADDDPVVSVVASDPDAAEPADDGTFTVSRDGGDQSQPLDVTVTVTGSATEGDDFATIGTTVTIPAGSASVDVLVDVMDDDLAEGDETVVLTLQPGAAYTVDATADDATVTIADGDIQVAIAASDADAAEPADDGTFTVTRSGSTDEAVTVAYTVTGSATNGTDYAMLSGTVVVPADETQATIPVDVIDDNEAEGAETVVVTLEDPEDDTPDYDVVSGEGSATVTIADDDVVVSVTASDPDAAEPADDGAFTFERTGDTSGELTVTYTVGGTATNGTDYATLSGSVTFAAGETAVVEDVDVIEDTTAEGGTTGNETVVVTLDASTDYEVDDTADDATVTIQDDDVAVRVVAADAMAGEPADDGTFTFTRIGDQRPAIEVSYTVGGTAMAGSDYEALDGTVSIAAGESNATELVDVIDDAAAENRETVIVTVTSGAGYAVADPSSATVTIDDNDTVVTIETLDGSGAEGTSDNGRVRFVRSGSTAESLTVNVTFGGDATRGDDYTFTTPVMIPAGATGVERAVTVLDDQVVEGEESAIITIAPGSYTIGTPSEATVTIADDDAFTVSVTASDATAGEPDGDGAFTVSRSGADNTGALEVAVAITGSATNGADYVEITSPVTIPDGKASVEVPVDVIDDGAIEDDETVVLTVQADPGYTVGTPSEATVTITSNDAFTVSVTASDAEASEPEDDGAFTVSRSGADNSAALDVMVTVTGSATADADFTAISSPVTIPAGQDSVAVPVDVIDDTVVEDDETVVLTVQADAGYTVGTPSEATVTITSNDAFTVSVTASDAEASEPDGDGAFTVSRSGADNSAALDVMVTVTGSATADADFTAISSPVTIPAGQDSVAVPVDVIDDTVVEDDETVVLTVQADAGYTVGTPSEATVTITSNDVFTVSVTASDAEASEPDGDGAFTVSRTGADNSAALDVMVTVTGSATADADFTAISSPVTIPAGQDSVAVPVDVIDDPAVEGDETVVLTISEDADYTVGTPSEATVTIADDDEEPVAETPVVRVITPDANAAEPSSTGRFQFRRTGDTSDELVIAIDVTGTASAGSDYVSLGDEVRFAPGATFVSVLVRPIDDQAVESDETVVVTIEDGAEYDVDPEDDSSTVTIADDDEVDEEPTEEPTDEPTDEPTEDDDVLLRRFEGSDRIATSVVLSQEAFPTGSDVAVLARGDEYPDALAGGPLAFAVGAPILLTDQAALSPATATELQRLGVSTVYLLGGPAALSTQVQADVTARGITDVRRLEGGDRFATAVAIARELLAVDGTTTATDVYVTEGANPDPSRGWPDAVSVAPLAAFQGRPVLLVTQGALPPATAAAFGELGVQRAVVAGGPVAVGDTVLGQMQASGVASTRVFGGTRYDTSRAVADLARSAGMEEERTWFATGRNFADALVGGPVIAADAGVLLLLDGQDLAGSPPAEAWLREFGPAIEEVDLLGGPVAISETVRRQVETVLRDVR